MEIQTSKPKKRKPQKLYRRCALYGYQKKKVDDKTMGDGRKEGRGGISVW
jgi:hypothetical protein